MAFDDVPNGDPRGPICPSCRRPIEANAPRTLVHTGAQSVYWHSECARHIWDTITPVIARLNRTWSR